MYKGEWDLPHTYTHTHTHNTHICREEAKLIARQRGEDGPLVVKFYNDPQIRTLRLKHQRSATFPLPAVFSKLPPSVASFMLPSANEALLIGEGLRLFVLVLPDGSACSKYPAHLPLMTVFFTPSLPSSCPPLHPRSRGVDIMHIDSIRFESVSKTQTYNAQICDLNRKQ